MCVPGTTTHVGTLFSLVFFFFVFVGTFCRSPLRVRVCVCVVTGLYFLHRGAHNEEVIIRSCFRNNSAVFCFFLNELMVMRRV